MGQLVNLNCKKCGYDTNLALGVGRAFNRLDAVLSSFAPKTQEMIRDQVAAKGISWEAYNAAGRCKSCEKIRTIAVLEASGASDERIKYHAACQCGSLEMDLFDPDQVTDGKVGMTCPECGARLDSKIAGYWD